MAAAAEQVLRGTDLPAVPQDEAGDESDGDEEAAGGIYNIPVLGLLQGSYGQPRTVTATIA